MPIEIDGKLVGTKHWAKQHQLEFKNVRVVIIDASSRWRQTTFIRHWLLTKLSLNGFCIHFFRFNRRKVPCFSPRINSNSCFIYLGEKKLLQRNKLIKIARIYHLIWLSKTNLYTTERRKIKFLNKNLVSVGDNRQSIVSNSTQRFQKTGIFSRDVAVVDDCFFIKKT